MKVTKKFRDKFTKVVYRVGDDYTHPDSARLDKLVGAGYLAPDPVSEDSEEGQSDYQLMTKRELREELDRQGIEYTQRMNKQELIELLR